MSHGRHIDDVLSVPPTAAPRGLGAHDPATSPHDVRPHDVPPQCPLRGVDEQRGGVEDPERFRGGDAHQDERLDDEGGEHVGQAGSGPRVEIRTRGLHTPALRERGELRAGGRVLVWGASGGVGHLAVQIARLLGASRVDAVCSSRSAAFVKGLGADTIIDYTQDQTPTGPYDVIVDTVCTASPALVSQLLTPHGVIVTIGALGAGHLLGPAAPMARRAVGARLRGFTSRTVLTRVNAEDLALLASWMEAGTLRVTIAGTYPLSDAVGAYQRLEAGRVHGKLAIVCDQSLLDQMRDTTGN